MASLPQDGSGGDEDVGHERMAATQASFRDFAGLCHTRRSERPLFQLHVDSREIEMCADQVRVRRSKGRFNESDQLQEVFLRGHPLLVEG